MLILEVMLFFLRYEEGDQIDPLPEKTTLKKPSLIRVKNKKSEISADAVWLACCGKSIYQELKKVNAWNLTVWSIMVKGH